ASSMRLLLWSPRTWSPSIWSRPRPANKSIYLIGERYPVEMPGTARPSRLRTRCHGTPTPTPEDPASHPVGGIDAPHNRAHGRHGAGRTRMVGVSHRPRLGLVPLPHSRRGRFRVRGSV